MNRFLSVLITAGALGFAPIGFAHTNNNQDNQDKGSLSQKLDDLSNKHTDVNLKTENGKQLTATIPHEHASDLKKGDKLEVTEEPQQKSDEDQKDKGWF
ncbi:hypothetical protein FOG18_04995 [Legionella israelensis]|uniref:hypothetical protein n=1 Tax=Legionella israelensis TaxID=454 RepID=UPI0011800A43|nr:hypothetical protein [Legionella israelensis]QDP71971.1 hypothetical protein FOG18_04995 [Legionella israelensis]